MATTSLSTEPLVARTALRAPCDRLRGPVSYGETWPCTRTATVEFFLGNAEHRTFALHRLLDKPSFEIGFSIGFSIGFFKAVLGRGSHDWLRCQKDVFQKAPLVDRTGFEKPVLTKRLSNGANLKRKIC